MREENCEVLQREEKWAEIRRLRAILASEFEYVEKLRVSVGGRPFFHVFCFLLSFTFISIRR